jgi:hypothetical protein
VDRAQARRAPGVRGQRPGLRRPLGAEGHGRQARPPEMPRLATMRRAGPIASDWHVAWQDRLPWHCQEVRIGWRIVDVLAPKGYIIEFQHSRGVGDLHPGRQ